MKAFRAARGAKPTIVSTENTRLHVELEGVGEEVLYELQAVVSQPEEGTGLGRSSWAWNGRGTKKQVCGARK